MAVRPTISKHNMIANLDKTNENVDFHAIIDFLTGSTINYALLVDPDVIGPWYNNSGRRQGQLMTQ